MWTFFEMKNWRKSIVRLGETDHGTSELETLLMLNSFAKSIGYEDTELPFRDLSSPKAASDLQQEFLGFAYEASSETHNVSNPTDAVGASIDLETVIDDEAVIAAAELEDAAGANDDALNEFLLDQYEEGDVAVPIDENLFEPADERATTALEQQLEELQLIETVEKLDSLNYAIIQQELNKLFPNTNANESTLVAFKRFTNKKPWLPFRDPRSSTVATQTDKAEDDLFEEWTVEYDRRCSDNSSSRHYHRFTKRWNDEVTRRFTEWCNGDTAIQQLNYKSTNFLQNHFDNKKEWQSLQLSAPGNDEDRQMLQRTLRDNRLLLPTVSPPQQVQPTYYYGHGITPFGNPMTWNAELAAGALLYHNRQSQAAPFTFNRPTFPVDPPVAQRPVRYLFRKKKYCITCGWRKIQHCATEGMQRKDDPCRKNYCGNCYLLKEYHVDGAGAPLPFGTQCTFPTNAGCRDIKLDWYEKKVSS
jgi:hypothetical protein